jgi:membrane-associated phospholipid phosphatase
MVMVEGVVDEGRPRAAAWVGRLRRRRDGRAPLWFELAVMAWLFWLYDVINNLAPTRRALAIDNARAMLSLERSLGIDIELTLNRWLSGHSVLSFFATYDYFFAHVLVTFTVLGLLWWRQPELYRRMRTQLVIVNLIAFVIFWRYPLAPPRMLPRMGFTDIVASSHAVISWHSGALVHDADQFAAMPSLHIAWASWSSLAVWRLFRRRIVAVVAACYPLLTAFTVLSTGNHYVLDVLAGAGTLLCALGLELALQRGRERLALGRRVPVTLAAATSRCGMRSRTLRGLSRPSAPQSGTDAVVQSSSGPT